MITSPFTVLERTALEIVAVVVLSYILLSATAPVVVSANGLTVLAVVATLTLVAGEETQVIFPEYVPAKVVAANRT